MTKNKTKILLEIKNALKNNSRVELRGFGVFYSNTQKKSIRRNPKTGDKIFVPEKKTVNWKMSKEVFKKTKGFGKIHPGEDPDLTFRVWEAGYKTRFFSNAFVYHKRRINWKKFRQQVTKFGMVRAILNKWHPKTAKIAYWFPSFISIGFLISLVLAAFGIYWPILCVLAYVFLVFLGALVAGLSFKAAFLSIYAVAIQFFGYGLGFLKSSILVNFSNQRQF